MKLRLAMVSALVLIVLIPGLTVGLIPGYMITALVTPNTGGTGRCKLSPSSPAANPFMVKRADRLLLTVVTRNTAPSNLNLTTLLKISWRPTTGVWITNASTASATLLLKRTMGQVSTSLGLINNTQSVTAQFTMFFNRAGDYTLFIMAYSNNQQFFGNDPTCVKVS